MMLTKKAVKTINDKLFPTLKNKDYSFQQFIITFSGVPGTGKTNIAKNLEEKYKAVRINNDYIREIIRNEKLAEFELETEQLLQEYNFDLTTKIPFQNKRIILDKSMDRRYEWFLGVCESNNLKYFLIRLNVNSPREALKMLSKREKITQVEISSMERGSSVKIAILPASV